MRIGHWRGVMFAVALFSATAAGRSASADGFHNTIPREVLARDLATGEPYFAPPIPWGHYAKSGKCDHFGKTCSLCSLCKGKGCGSCGGRGCFGGLLDGHGHGLGHGGSGNCGSGHCGSGHGGNGLFGGHGGNGSFGSGGNGLFGGPCGHGLLNHCGKGSGDGCGDPGCGGSGHGRRVKNCGLCKGKGCGLCRSSGAGDPIHTLAAEPVPASARAVATSPEAIPVSSAQCSDPGCNLAKGHHHGGGGGASMGDPCGGCGGRGCGKCHGLGRLFGGNGNGGGNSMGDTCDGCGGRGCGKCHGLGRLFGGNGNGGGGDLCGSCGGKGCGLCGGLGRLVSKLCHFCGGKGCGKCGLGGHLKGKLGGLFHHGGKIKYFVGPGGPVPLTPGYVPYVVTTRSPRDFLAFPPYTPDGF